MSLVISITCALLATLLQQWARRYLKVTQTHYSLHKRARIRSFFAEGVESSLLPWVVEALPTLLHVSLVLFFAGLVVFLWSIDLTIFRLVLSWVGICTVLYGCITLIPIFRHDSPYHTPLTPLARPVVTAITLVFWVLYICFIWPFVCCYFCCSRNGPFRIFSSLPDWLSRVLEMSLLTPEKAALKVSLEIDARALMWTFSRLDQDHELELFFSGLPGFHNSKVVKEPLCSLDEEQKPRILIAMIGFLDRTFSSNLLPDQVKRRRADICANAIDLVHTPKAFPEVVRSLASEDWDGFGPVQSCKIVDFVGRWDNHMGEYTTMDQAIFSIVVARVQQRDDSWFTLASDGLGFPETVLRSHAARGDDTLSLAILIHVTRQQFIHLQDPVWPSETISDVLLAASKFNVQDTLPELQHEFCALWNQIVRKAQNDDDWGIADRILRPICQIYVTLHRNTDSSPTRFSAATHNEDVVLGNPTSHPVCDVPDHVLDEFAPTTFPLTILHENDAVLVAASPANPVAPSFPSIATFRIDENLTTVPSLDNSHPHTHLTIDSYHIPATSLDPATAGAVQDVVTPGITMPQAMPFPTPETSSSAPPLSSTFPPAVVLLQHNAGPPMPRSDSPKLPSAAFKPVLDNICPAGPLLSTHSLLTRSGLSQSFPECHPGPTSAPVVCAVGDDDCSLKPSLHEEKDVSDSHPVNLPVQADTIATLNLPAYSLSQLSVTDSDVPVVGRSSRESHVGAHSPHSGYDIV